MTSRKKFKMPFLRAANVGRPLSRMEPNIIKDDLSPVLPGLIGQQKRLE